MASSPPPAQQPTRPAGKSRRRGKKGEPDNLSVSGGAAASGPASPVGAPGSENGIPATSEAGGVKEKEYLREVAKRLKKQTKKLENIKKSEDKIKDLPDEEKATTRLINQDERKKIAEKPTTLTVHKELQEIHDKLKELADAEERAERNIDERLAEQRRQFDEKLAIAVKEAKQEGIQEGKQEKVSDNQYLVLTLIKFLRLAGYRRSFKSENPVEDEAIEKVLVLVYSGDAVAMEACSKLANASEDKIEDLEAGVTYGRIKELAYDLKLDEELAPEEAADEATETAAQETVVTNETGYPEEAQSYQALVEQENDAPPSYSLVETDHPSTIPATSVTSGDAANDAAKDAEAESLVNPAGDADYVVVEKSDSVVPEVQANGPGPEPQNKDGGFQNVESRRGRGGRGGHGHRGRGDGSHRGSYRGRGPFRGDRGEHRGRGSYRGHRGEGHRGGKGERPQQQQQQQQPQAVST